MDKKEIKRKLKAKLNTKLQEPKSIRWMWILLISPFAIVITMLFLAFLGVFGRLPSFEELENPKSNLSTEIYSEDGVMIGSFFVQNRSFVNYEDLSPNLVAALVATEDARFYDHSGIDFISLARVGVKTVALQRRDQGGGSTITQQLAKNLFPRDTAVYKNAISRGSKLVFAKMKEWITAVKLEYNYTKEEIIAMYLNTVEFGSNAYGIKSAARTFFNKTPKDLTIEEAAMLVGVVNAPSRYSPVRNYDRAMVRRNTVINRMEKSKYISVKERDSLSSLAIKLNFKPISHNQGAGTYFREMLRLVLTAKRPAHSQFINDWDYQQELKRWETNPLYGWCEKNIKPDGSKYNIYRDGLRIYTTINSAMQKYGEDALVNQLSSTIQPAMDSQVKRSKRLFIKASKSDIEKIIQTAMRQTDRYRYMKNRGATDQEIEKSFNTPVEMRLFTYKGDRDTVMTPRDSILYYKQMMRASFMALDPSNGHVKAYVGGPDFRYFKYDMVKQGKRQVGSTMKPFIYTFAIDHLGLSACTPVPNLPTTIETQTGDAWQPKEAGKVVYDGKPRPLWWGLANSRNNYSAWIMKQAKQPSAVADYIHKLGIMSYIDPVYALCLGTPDVSLFEMVGSYGIYPNRGVFNDPIFVTRIEDKHGNILATFTNNSYDAISERTANTMLGMLKNVIDAGTAGRLRWKYGFKGEMGGKTGTSQNASDAWFIGVFPKLVAGAWVGGEDRSVHLVSGGEGSVMALPIVGDFMKKVYSNPAMSVKENDPFPVGVGLNCTSENTVQAADTLNVEAEFFD